jgi:sugar phosphate isomerase/epimerase
MNVLLFKTLWGHDGSLAEAMNLAVESGFSGLETPYPTDKEEQEEFADLLSTKELTFIAEISTATGPGLYVPMAEKSAVDHVDSLREGIENCLPGNPLFINSMAGSDAWEFSEALQFYEAVPALEKEYNVAISVETHRGRYLNSPWTTRRILQEIPELKLTCDFSHFCVVSERLILDEEPEILELCARHAFHVQTRVGYDQGPQVPDPRAPEHAEDLAAHERWWDKVWKSQMDRGFDRITLTPEFGPDGYLHCQPFTGKPVADLWEINQWIALRQCGRLLQNLN